MLVVDDEVSASLGSVQTLITREAFIWMFEISVFVAMKKNQQQTDKRIYQMSSLQFQKI